MSRIDELISERCPQGIEFMPIGDVTKKSVNIKWGDIDESKKYSYIDLSAVDRVTKKIGETSTITSAKAPSRARQVVKYGDVIFATTRPTQMRWAIISKEYDNQIVSTGYCVLRPREDYILTGFLAHLLSTDSFRRYVEASQVEGNYPSIADDRVRAYQIPVPPFEVQRAIVEILDKFTALEAELEAELEARKKQYDFYRLELLSFDEAVQWLTVDDLCEVTRGRVMSKDYLAANAGQYPVYSSQTANSGIFGWIDTYDYQDESITWTTDGANAGSVFYHIDKKFSITNVCGLLRIKPGADVTTKYLYHCLSIMTKRHVSAGMGNPKLMSTAMKKIKVPIPSRAEQERVVKVLDKFDALVNDLSSGLPAEIAARRKQYEYYRDQMLTFKELAS